MNKWEKVLILPTTPIVKAIEILDSGAIGIAVVVDESRKLLGTITDGDIRRAVLRNVNLKDACSTIMNSQPTFVHANVSREKILDVMRERFLRQIIVVDDEHRIVRVETVLELIGSESHKNPVVLMAGGEGKRLYPLTKDCPKPLLKVGSKPILHTIVDNFVSQGFKHFYISVNYKAEMIESYFGSGADFGAEIRYLRETRHLGTAGSIGLLPETPKTPFIVMNGDLLTKVNFQHLLDFHASHGAEATVCVRQHDIQVPYGVVSADKERILRIDEKPIHSFFVNGGIYVFNPSVFDLFNSDTHTDMTDVLSKLISMNRHVAAFPLREYWLDIGQVDDFERAQQEFLKIFST